MLNSGIHLASSVQIIVGKACNREDQCNNVLPVRLRISNCISSNFLGSGLAPALNKNNGECQNMALGSICLHFFLKLI